MRKSLLILPLLICATPALAQDRPTGDQIAARAHRSGDRRQARQDHAALSKALLDLPVGEIQAAVEGREADAGRAATLTVGDLARRDDPEFRPQRSSADRRGRAEDAARA